MAQRSLVAPAERPSTSAISELTPRMREILGHLLEGRTEKEVARALGLSPHTIHIHVTRMYGRLGVSSRAELFALAYRSGLVRQLEPDGPGDGQVTAPSAYVAPAAATPPHAENGGTDRSANTVLFVDDHADTRMVISRLLSRAGFDVLTAATYHEALTAAQTVRVDVLIADVGLPDGNGLDLLAEVRRAYPVSGIVLGGYGMGDDRSSAARAGFARYLTKPIDSDELVRAIRDVLREPAPVAPRACVTAPSSGWGDGHC